MNDSTLKTLLKQYEQKRLAALTDLDKRKQDLYNSNKDLEAINTQLNLSSLNMAKLILTTPRDIDTLDNLKKKIHDLKKEKESLLQKLHIDTSFFKPQFECSFCEDTGYVQEDYQFHLCNCIKQKLFDLEYNKSNIGNLEKDNFEHFNFDLYSDTINETLYSANLSPRDNMKNIKQIALSFITNFDHDAEKNLLFIGNTGLGKTFLSNCIANELLKKGKTVLYQTAPVMLDTIIDYRFNKNMHIPYTAVRPDMAELPGHRSYY